MKLTLLNAANRTALVIGLCPWGIRIADRWGRGGTNRTAGNEVAIAARERIALERLRRRRRIAIRIRIHIASKSPPEECGDASRHSVPKPRPARSRPWTRARRRRLGARLQRFAEIHYRPRTCRFPERSLSKTTALMWNARDRRTLRDVSQASRRGLRLNDCESIPMGPRSEILMGRTQQGENEDGLRVKPTRSGGGLSVRLLLKPPGLASHT